MIVVIFLVSCTVHGGGVACRKQEHENPSCHVNYGADYIYKQGLLQEACSIYSRRSNMHTYKFSALAWTLESRDRIT